MIRNLEGVEFAPPTHEPALHCTVDREGGLIVAGAGCEKDHEDTHGRWKLRGDAWHRID